MLPARLLPASTGDSAQEASLGLGRPSPAGGFGELDALLASRVAPPRGLIAIRAPAGAAHALGAHARRRLEGRGLDVVVVDGRAVDDPFREAFARLGEAPAPGAARGGAVALDPAEAAASIARGASTRALVLIESTRRAWGAAVGAELARLSADGSFLVLWIATSFAGLDLGSSIVPFELGLTLDESELDCWWRAAASEAAAIARRRRSAVASSDGREGSFGLLGTSDRIDDAERWFEAALALPAQSRVPALPIGDGARSILGALLAARRAWPASRLGELLCSAADRVAGDGADGDGAAGASATASDLDELRAFDLVSLDAMGGVAATSRAIALQAELPQAGLPQAGLLSGASPAATAAVARALEGETADPWSLCRAAEIHAALGAIDAAERAAHAALGSLADAPLREDLWSRWIACLEASPEQGRTARLVRSSELALRVGHVDIALRLARDAAASAPTDHSTLLAMGRALAARGDLVGAEVALERALARAPGALGRAAASVELAEVRYGTGDLEGAQRWAEQAIAAVSVPATELASAGLASTGLASTGLASIELASAAPGSIDGAERMAAQLRISGRNVAGKVLLARSAWAEAETHFAADAFEAACARDGMAELRAQTNRAIALLSSGRLDEARQMLLAVHDAGESRGELRAVTFALANLATLATLRHAYADALSLSERAFHAYRRLGERVRLAPLATNLAELRLRIGLVDEAEHGLRFGIKACGRDLPAMRLAHFSLVSAQIQLARGKTQAASTELASALSAMKGTDGARVWGGPAGLLLSQCHRLAARVALEDGDVRRAERALDIARREPPTPFARAEIAIVATAVAQAGGVPFGEIAAEALELAREADDVELVVEAYALVTEAALAAGDVERAAGALRAARAARDEVAESLPASLRSHYLTRRHAPDLDRLAHRLELGRLELGRIAGRGPDTQGLDGRCEAAPAELVMRRLDSSPPPSRHSGPPTARPSAVTLTPAGAAAFARIVGNEPSILALLTAIPKVAGSDATVLIHGESGTGKELVAEAIHATSPRAGGPLVKVNCAALVETLLLSELFGHEKGAFTGASGRRRGRFEAAEGGTIFLDEIGDISARTQVALLRVLQDRTFERVGGSTQVRANVRIVCATHRDLRAMVARGEFREDLYYRLRGVVLEVPALRQRIADLPVIAASLLGRVAAERSEMPKRLGTHAAAALARHPWPGNVRELENALRAAALFADGEVIELEDFTGNVQGLQALLLPGPTSSDGADLSIPSGPPTLRVASASRGSAPGGERSRDDGPGGAPVRATDVAYDAVRSGVSLGELKRRIERECIARALAESDGNITRAATVLGMKRPRLSQLVKQYGLGSYDLGGGDLDGGDLVPDDQDGSRPDDVDGDSERRTTECGGEACEPEDV